MLRLYSVFHSIQGESTWAGLPTIFIRLAGCPLRCAYCDTRDAAEASGLEVTVGEIIEQIKKWKTGIVEVTGGEPLAQRETPLLLSRLADENYTVLLETSGAFPLTPVDSRVRIIMDIKCPDSGENQSFMDRNVFHLQKGRDEVKFVISSLQDFEFALESCRRWKLWEKAELLVSPVHGLVNLESVAEWILSSSLPLRLQPQLHKVIWPMAKGER